MSKTEDGPFLSTARVRTELPDRYMRQLCSHFAHKIPASCNESDGMIEFEFGTCDLKVEAGNALIMTASADSIEQLERVQHVVTKHLKKFAWRDDPEIAWSEI